MNLKQIETVALVARLGSISKAATSLGVSQSLLSRNISLLELAWGQRLFERSGRGLSLTAFGRCILPECETLMLQQKRIESIVGGASGFTRGVVTLGVAPSVAQAVIPKFMRELKSLMPDISLNVHEGVSGQLDEWLESGKVDLAIANRHAERVPKDEDLLAEVPMYLVSSATRSVDEQTVHFSRLDGVPLALPAAPSEFRNSLSKQASQLGLALNIVFESESIGLLKDVVRSGSAATILPMSGIRSEVAAGSLKAARLVSPEFVRKITLCAGSQHRLSHGTRQVMRHINTLVPSLVREASVWS